LTLPNEGEAFFSDIALFITARITEFDKFYRENEIGPTILRRLIDLSAGSFRLAKMACDLIEFRFFDPSGRSKNHLDLQHYKNYLMRHRGHPVRNITSTEFDKFLPVVDDIIREWDKMISDEACMSSQLLFQHSVLLDPANGLDTEPPSAVDAPVVGLQTATTTKNIPNNGAIADKAVQQRRTALSATVLRLPRVLAHPQMECPRWTRRQPPSSPKQAPFQVYLH
jgi:hypothetical protein